MSAELSQPSGLDEQWCFRRKDGSGPSVVVEHKTWAGARELAAKELQADKTEIACVNSPYYKGAVD